MFFFIALTIANNVGYTERPITDAEADVKYTQLPSLKKYRTTIHEENPFDWGRTWYIWMGCFILCCIFEYKLFADKKRINNKRIDFNNKN